MVKKKKSKNGSIIAKATLKIAPCALILAGATSYLVQSYQGELLAQREYDQLSNSIKNEQTVGQIPDDRIDTPVVEPIETEETEVIEVEEPHQYYSSSLFDSGYEFDSIDFESLRQINPDTVGWIVIDDTIIDYPIVQGDDNDYYLHHNIERDSSSSGTIFQDSRNASFDLPTYELNDVSYFYGHCMKSGSMFATLLNYKQQSYFEDHPFAVIYTPDGYAYQVEFFADYVISGESDENLYVDAFVDEDDFYSYVNNARENSLINSDVEVNYGDNLVVLVTCSYETSNSRNILIGKVSGKQCINEQQIEELVNNGYEYYNRSRGL